MISATNRDIESLLADGRLREDLYYRVNTLTVRTPALRDRSADIPALARHFLEAACRRNHWKKRAISAEALGLDIREET